MSQSVGQSVGQNVGGADLYFLKGMAKRFPHLVVVWVEGCGKTLFSQGRVSKKEGKVWYFATPPPPPPPPPPGMVFFWEFFLPKFVLLEISSQRGETNVTLGPISKIIFFFVH